MQTTFMRQGRSSKFWGFQFERFFGHPWLQDPEGRYTGWTACIGLPFVAIGFRALKEKP